MIKQLKYAAGFLGVFTVLTGGGYPLLITIVVHTFFPWQANGSLLVHEGRVTGSMLIGQPFTKPSYFWSRPSATAPFPYNAAGSTGSNVGPINPALVSAVNKRLQALKEADPSMTTMVPIDLVTTSASGLDPHISIAAAECQLKRVARERGWSETKVQKLVDKNTTGRFLGFLGEPVVHVLKLNLDLDAETN